MDISVAPPLVLEEVDVVKKMEMSYCFHSGCGKVGKSQDVVSELNANDHWTSSGDVMENI